LNNPDETKRNAPIGELVQVVLSIMAAVLGIIGAAILWGLGGALMAGCLLCIVLVILIGTVI
jgi:hypothetical protein